MQTLSLNGDWDFTYTQHPGSKTEPTVPEPSAFTVRMPVPGYWDDHLDRMRTAPFWGYEVRFNPHYRRIDFPMGDVYCPDASLSYLLGVGWYRRCFHAPAEWKERKVVLSVGGVLLEAWVWLNGHLVKYHLGHSTPFDVPLEQHLKLGAENELIIAVANTRTDRLGCVIRGFAGFSAGIYRSVQLRVSGWARIKEAFVHPVQGISALQWHVELDGDVGGRSAAELHWRITDTEVGSQLASSSVPADRHSLAWRTATFGMQPWSDVCPRLYEIAFELRQGGECIDTRMQRFGLRRLDRDGTQLRLNGQPVLLRGLTDHAYFPLTCTPPQNVEAYRDMIRKMKAIGFNWIRCHTWAPSEEYMHAADELGMMMQVEPPVGFGEQITQDIYGVESMRSTQGDVMDTQEWRDILRACRVHPSVVLYCCGNEELLDDNRIEEVRVLADLCHTLVPDALFNPYEALRGVAYMCTEPGIQNELVHDPFVHHPRRLNALREFSDVFGSYAQGLLSYSSLQGDWQALDKQMEIYGRPLLSHEIGIHGSYLNLDLEHRYEGTRIGTDMFASVRRYLKREGLLSRASLYYRNSCAWMKVLRKHCVETARKCRYLAGYDFLGSHDHNYHQCAYPVGILNEFFELKPGECAADVLQYNGESVLLLDHTNYRNLATGDVLSLDLFASLYGAEPLAEGRVEWRLADGGHAVLARGAATVNDLRNGAITKLTTITLRAPNLEAPARLTLHARLSGGDYELTNAWDYWVFPPLQPLAAAVCPDAVLSVRFKDVLERLHVGVSGRASLRLVSALNKEHIDYLADGGRIVLLGGAPFPTLPTSFQMSPAGRVQGNLATVIEDHPITNSFPHEGFCDWQFYSMLEGGNAVLFNELPIPFDPILEVVSSFKLIRKQASLFELGVGKGYLLVCTLNLGETDPAAICLLRILLNYAQSDDFRPARSVAPGTLLGLLEESISVSYDFSTHEALDPNASRAGERSE